MAQRHRVRRRQAERRAIQREDRRARHQARRRLRRWMYLGISGVIAILVTISLFLPQLPFGRGQGGTGSLLEVIPEGTDYFGYATLPPTFGPHWPEGAAWGVHTEEIRNERQVRNLASGGVLIQYNTDDQELIDTLTQFAKSQPDFPCYLIVAPYSDMESTIAVTAWGAPDNMEEYDEERIQQFSDIYRGQGPDPEPCTP